MFILQLKPGCSRSIAKSCMKRLFGTLAVLILYRSFVELTKSFNLDPYRTVVQFPIAAFIRQDDGLIPVVFMQLRIGSPAYRRISQCQALDWVVIQSNRSCFASYVLNLAGNFDLDIYINLVSIVNPTKFL